MSTSDEWADPAVKEAYERVMAFTFELGDAPIRSDIDTLLEWAWKTRDMVAIPYLDLRDFNAPK